MRKIHSNRQKHRKGDVCDQKNAYLLVSISLVTLVILTRSDVKKTKREVRYLCLGCKICFCEEKEIFQVKNKIGRKKEELAQMFKFSLVIKKKLVPN